MSARLIRSSLPGLFALLLSLPLLACPAGVSTPVLVGWEPWEPYTFTDDTGRETGVDLEVQREVLRRMGCTVQFVNHPWKRLLAEIEQGVMHMTGSASFSDERAQWGHFSIPYRKEKMQLLVREGEAAGFRETIRTLRDLPGHGFVLGITRGYYYGPEVDWLEQQADYFADLQPVSEDALNFHKLALGRIDGFLGDPLPTAVGIRAQGLTLRTEPLLTITEGDIHVLISRKAVTDEFLQRFNQELQAMISEGFVDKLIARFGGMPLP
ncbi:substrate-binding periplasmic protein [Thalassolituus sp. LLYu03]|uniref:substrate-binding periplasmic protein n=1 Tax=Thalassolituus sp. LLYu03 TaxID=3421656 RepID=UPI003D28133B